MEADEAQRLERIVKRDNLSYDDAIARIKARDLALVKAKCDFVIVNDGDADRLEKETMEKVFKCVGKDIFDK